MLVFYIYSLISLVILVLLTFNYQINAYYFKDITHFYLKNSENIKKPFVSVLIPARNEEKNIKTCLLSLINQDYQNYEILVLNDNSEDKTLRIAKKISEHYPIVRVIDGRPLEKGWVGKNYACFQLSKEARGSYLLFTDADTIHSDNSISSGINCLISSKLDGLSAYPKQITRSVSEKLYVKNITLGILLFIPLLFMKRSKSLMTNPALGSYMLYRKQVYESVGGHRNIHDRCLEDMNMARLLKSKGYDFRIFDGKKIYKTRMYEDFPSIYRSVGRFSLTFFNSRLWMGLIFYSLIFLVLGLPFLGVVVLPFFLNSGLEFMRQSFAIFACQVAILLALRVAYAARFNGDFIEIILHPISLLLLFGMSLSLFFKGKDYSKKINWKNRKYSVSHGI